MFQFNGFQWRKIFTRRIIFKKVSTKYKQSNKSNDPIEGEYKDLDE